MIGVARLLDDPFFLGLLPRSLGFGALLSFFFGQRCLAPLFLGALASRFVSGRAPLLLLFDALTLLGLALLRHLEFAFGSLAPLLFLARGALDGRARFLFGAALRIELFLLLTRLLLEHVALDIGAFLADLDVDRPSAPLAAR